MSEKLITSELVEEEKTEYYFGKIFDYCKGDVDDICNILIKKDESAEKEFLKKISQEQQEEAKKYLKILQKKVCSPEYNYLHLIQRWCDELFKDKDEEKRFINLIKFNECIKSYEVYNYILEIEVEHKYSDDIEKAIRNFFKNINKTIKEDDKKKKEEIISKQYEQTIEDYYKYFFKKLEKKDVETIKQNLKKQHKDYDKLLDNFLKNSIEKEEFKKIFFNIIGIKDKKIEYFDDVLNLKYLKIDNNNFKVYEENNKGLSDEKNILKKNFFLKKISNLNISENEKEDFIKKFDSFLSDSKNNNAKNIFEFCKKFCKYLPKDNRVDETSFFDFLTYLLDNSKFTDKQKEEVREEIDKFFIICNNVRDIDVLSNFVSINSPILYKNFKTLLDILKKPLYKSSNNTKVIDIIFSLEEENYHTLSSICEKIRDGNGKFDRFINCIEESLKKEIEDNKVFDEKKLSIFLCNNFLEKQPDKTKFSDNIYKQIMNEELKSLKKGDKESELNFDKIDYFINSLISSFKEKKTIKYFTKDTKDEFNKFFENITINIKDKENEDIINLLKTNIDEIIQKEIKDVSINNFDDLFEAYKQEKTDEAEAYIEGLSILKKYGFIKECIARIEKLYKDFNEKVDNFKKSNSDEDLNSLEEIKKKIFFYKSVFDKYKKKYKQQYEDYKDSKGAKSLGVNFKEIEEIFEKTGKTFDKCEDDKKKRDNLFSYLECLRDCNDEKHTTTLKNKIDKQIDYLIARSALLQKSEYILFRLNDYLSSLIKGCYQTREENKTEDEKKIIKEQYDKNGDIVGDIEEVSAIDKKEDDIKLDSSFNKQLITTLVKIQNIGLEYKEKKQKLLDIIKELSANGKTTKKIEMLKFLIENMEVNFKIYGWKTSINVGKFISKQQLENLNFIDGDLDKLYEVKRRIGDVMFEKIIQSYIDNVIDYSIYYKHYNNDYENVIESINFIKDNKDKIFLLNKKINMFVDVEKQNEFIKNLFNIDFEKIDNKKEVFKKTGLNDKWFEEIEKTKNFVPFEEFYELKNKVATMQKKRGLPLYEDYVLNKELKKIDVKSKLDKDKYSIKAHIEIVKAQDVDYLLEEIKKDFCEEFLDCDDKRLEDNNELLDVILDKIETLKNNNLLDKENYYKLNKMAIATENILNKKKENIENERKYIEKYLYELLDENNIKFNKDSNIEKVIEYIEQINYIKSRLIELYKDNVKAKDFVSKTVNRMDKYLQFLNDIKKKTAFYKGNEKFVEDDKVALFKDFHNLLKKIRDEKFGLDDKIVLNEREHYYNLVQKYLQNNENDINVFLHKMDVLLKKYEIKPEGLYLDYVKIYGDYEYDFLPMINTMVVVNKQKMEQNHKNKEDIDNKTKKMNINKSDFSQSYTRDEKVVTNGIKRPLSTVQQNNFLKTKHEDDDEKLSKRRIETDEDEDFDKETEASSVDYEDNVDDGKETKIVVKDRNVLNDESVKSFDEKRPEIDFVKAAFLFIFTAVIGMVIYIINQKKKQQEYDLKHREVDNKTEISLKQNNQEMGVQPYIQ